MIPMDKEQEIQVQCKYSTLWSKHIGTGNLTGGIKGIVKPPKNTS